MEGAEEVKDQESRQRIQKRNHQGKLLTRDCDGKTLEGLCVAKHLVVWASGGQQSAVGKSL